MEAIVLRPVEVKRDFGELAHLFSVEQDEPVSEHELKLDYEAHKERIVRVMVAEDATGELLGFSWATRSRYDSNQAYFYVMVKPQHRKQGVGGQLYADLERAAQRAEIQSLEVNIRDACQECRSFAEQRGFTDQSHYIGLALNLDDFDDRMYDGTIAKLKGDGFQFTSMEELGDTKEAKHKLYHLNDTTNMEMNVPEDQHIWLSFDDFQKKVCQMDWYKPEGQLVAIDTVTGTWAGMSAITRYTGSDHAYNLHTGVDRRYCGRDLAQVLLVLAARYAQEVLRAKSVHSDENARNLSSIAIYRKLGYVKTPGTIAMEKKLP